MKSRNLVYSVVVFAINLVLASPASALQMSTPVSGGTLTWNETDTTVLTLCYGSKFQEQKRTSTNFAFSGGTITNPNVTTTAVHACDNTYTAVPEAEVLTVSGGCAITFDPATETATGTCTPAPLPIHPKYEIVGLTYAPPGPQSFVQYTNASLLGTTVSYNSSFANQNAISISSSYSFGIGEIIKGTSTASYSTSWTSTKTSSSSISIQQQSSQSYKLPGVPNAFAPSNHDYDIIWLWLNPVELYNVNTTVNTIQFTGMGFDGADQPDLDVYPVYVGTLNGHFAMTAADQTALGRAWASSQWFPAGDGPALTATDYANILAVDPFTNPNYAFNVNGGVSPATTTDSRFSIASGSANDFIYKPGSPTVTLTNTYSNSAVTGQGSSYQTQRTFGIDTQFKGSLWLSSFSADLKLSNTVTSVHSQTNQTTKTNQAISSLSISPPCAAIQCTPAYTGFSEFDVYQDNLFGTFMFYPVR